ncbi:MAG: lysozyme inhibitor LprI family protein [Rhizomicrobium sp.]
MIRSLVLAIPLVLLAAPALAGDEDNTDCAKAITQNDMNICADKDYQAADKKLNDVYRQVMAALDDAGYQAKLKIAEKAWLQYRDTECTFEVAQNEGGTIYPLVYSGCVTRLTDARTKELRAYLACWKNADKCGG